MINPLRWMKGPKVTPYSRLPKRIDREHMEALWREAAHRGGDYSSHLWITVLAMLYGTGLRRGELQRLNLDCFDLTEGTLRIDGRKTGRERCVPLPEMVLRCLEAYMSRRMKAIDILNELYVKEPGNPAVAHYLIHATDTPELAHLGLNAARRYAMIAPDAPHALHMPSHIFTELGMWQESIRSNLASAAVAEKNTKANVDNESGDQIHALSCLQYAYLQTGRVADALRVINEVKKVPGASAEDITNNQSMLQAAYFEETHDWHVAAAFVAEPDSYPMIQVLAYAVRAIGEARTGDVAGANADVQKLRDATKTMQVAMKEMGMNGWWSTGFERNFE